MESYKIIFVEKSVNIKKDVIRKIPYFSHMIDGCDSDFEEIEVPRMGFMFDHVLAFVISPLYPYPVEYYDELDFYDINYDKYKLFDKNKIQLNVIENAIRNCHQSTVFTSRKCDQCQCPDTKSINNTYIVCENHRNKSKCQTLGCRIDTYQYNYCGQHQNYDVYNSKNVLCKKLGCGLHRIKNNYYCYLHYQ